MSGGEHKHLDTPLLRKSGKSFGDPMLSDGSDGTQSRGVPGKAVIKDTVALRAHHQPTSENGVPSSLHGSLIILMHLPL